MHAYKYTTKACVHTRQHVTVPPQHSCFWYARGIGILNEKSANSFPSPVLSHVKCPWIHHLPDQSTSHSSSEIHALMLCCCQEWCQHFDSCWIGYVMLNPNIPMTFLNPLAKRPTPKKKRKQKPTTTKSKPMTSWRICCSWEPVHY